MSYEAFDFDLPRNKIVAVINARSARGLSFSSYILETLSYAITLAYSYRNQFPFSTYGENLFLTIQNTVVTLLILAYAPSSLRSDNKAQKITVALVATIATAFALYVIPSQTLSLLQMSTLPLSLFSKLPQIRQNARTQSTGQLSAVAVIAQVAGCLARLFTTATEVGDALVSAGFALALLLNIVLGAQLYMYWGESDVTESHELGKAHGYAEVEKVKEQESSAPAAFEPASWQQQQTPQQRVATPPPRTPSSASGRKWARKVD